MSEMNGHGGGCGVRSYVALTTEPNPLIKRIYELILGKQTR